MGRTFDQAAYDEVPCPLHGAADTSVLCNRLRTSCPRGCSNKIKIGHQQYVSVHVSAQGHAGALRHWPSLPAGAHCLLLTSSCSKACQLQPAGAKPDDTSIKQAGADVQVLDACALRPDLAVLEAGDQSEIGEKARATAAVCWLHTFLAASLLCKHAFSAQLRDACSSAGLWRSLVTS